MTSEVLTSAGAVIILLWGVAHLVPTRSVVHGFGPISVENRRIITMEWVAEGLTLCFLGVLVLLVVLREGLTPTSILVCKTYAAMLLLVAGVRGSLFVMMIKSLKSASM